MVNGASDGQKPESGKMSKIDIFKVVATLIGVATFLISFMTAIIQYRQFVQQEMDKSFRAVVENLSSAEKEKRLAAASSTGTFISSPGSFIMRGDKYYQEAIDILVNRLSIELDYNVLNAIKGSLVKVAQKDFILVINKLQDIDRSFFLQEYALRNWSNSARKYYEDSSQNYRDAALSYQANPTEADKEILKNLKEYMNEKWEDAIQRQNAFDELYMHKQVISDFLSNFLNITKDYPIEGLDFFRNSMNNASLMELEIRNSRIKDSAISSANIWYTKFDGSLIDSTYFSFSHIKETSFIGCKIYSSLFDESSLIRVDFSGSEFDNVFFIGSDLTGSRFTDTKGLKPIYFYKAKNLDKAIFEPSFKDMLTKTKITDQQFTEYIRQQDLLEQGKKEALINALTRL